MRLWSIHPKYLDPIGLVALWREGLLALEVLKGNTKGYRNHPQLVRFQNTSDPVESMKNYLFYIYQESISRNYHFNARKISSIQKVDPINVTTGQLEYELVHLKNKLAERNTARFKEIENITKPVPHPLFRTVKGNAATWEKIKM